MSDCEDMTTQLAKELMSGLKENVDELADSFKKMAILGNREQKEIPEPEQEASTPVEPSKPKVATTPTVIFPIQPIIQSTKANGENHDTGQLSLFDLVA